MIENKSVGCAQTKIVKDGFLMIIIKYRGKALAIMKHSTLRKSRIDLGKHSNENSYYRKNIEIDFSKSGIDCLQIRTKEKHSGLQKSIKLVFQQPNRKFRWGFSRKYGFHCFNGLQDKGDCPNFEYRVCRNCPLK